MKWSTNASLSPAARLKRRADVWAVKLRVMPRLVRVQKMSRKWGSCSTAGTVTLAIDLDDQHESFQDFVVVHELLHLKVRNHGRLFKALMTTHVPNWRILHSDRIADEWVRLPNRNPIFAKDTPLAYMIRGGLPAMQTVRRLLDARRAG